MGFAGFDYSTVFDKAMGDSHSTNPPLLLDEYKLEFNVALPSIN